MPGRYFSEILPEVSNYVTYGPQHYLNEKWDCDTLSLEYEGQEIDITDVDTLRMSNKERNAWLIPKELYRKFQPVHTTADDIKVTLLHPRDLVAYKKELDGDHQLVDIGAVEKYIAQNNL